jgi:hypothetical protein
MSAAQPDVGAVSGETRDEWLARALQGLRDLIAHEAMASACPAKSAAGPNATAIERANMIEQMASTRRMLVKKVARIRSDARIDPVVRREGIARLDRSMAGLDGAIKHIDRHGFRWNVMEVVQPGTPVDVLPNGWRPYLAYDAVEEWRP